MPILDWIGKDAVVNHDKEVPFRLLKKVKSLSVDENSQNLIIHGDNLEGLKALMPYYQGKVKCIYIDPPYNTGNDGWVYNDKVNSPKIKKWLGKVVGNESEDLCRHDKWLCMMYPRLKLLYQLLKEDGAILVSIDDNEVHNLRLIMDEIFGEKNFLATIIWQRAYAPVSLNKYFSQNHDYIVAYTKNLDSFSINKLERTEKQLKDYKNPDNDPRGLWKLGNPSVGPAIEKNIYEIVTPSGRKLLPPKGRSWLYSEKRFEELKKDNRIWFGKEGASMWGPKLFLSEVSPGITPLTLWEYKEVGHTQDAKREIKVLFPEEANPFPTPKPVELLKRIIKLTSNKEDLVLDSFAGSGTTGNAVLDLNKADGGHRKFILVELEDGIAKDITAERIKRAIKKYDYKDGFEYCELDKPLFNEYGQIDEECSFDQLATYIYFTETNTNIDKGTMSGNFIGEYNETEYYLIFKERGKNVLNKEFLKKLQKDSKKRVIYADKCLIDEKTLEKYKIQFKQIPYEVKVY